MQIKISLRFDGARAQTLIIIIAASTFKNSCVYLTRLISDIQAAKKIFARKKFFCYHE
ncbi:MAG: hypothetical protein IJQ82_00560 [Selenomonadaceae bacterium]|nr:hypothetical protein [Selenomonadaceae bacterium]